MFQTNMISLEALPKIIDTTQLTSDLEGTLHYDHSQWIDMRLVSTERKQHKQLCSIKTFYSSEIDTCVASYSYSQVKW